MIAKRDWPKFDRRKYYFDEVAAERVVKFIETYCRHIQGNLAGELIVLERWQKRDIIYPVFGVKQKRNGFRKHRVCWVEIPKKNGKSTILAALTLYMLGADGERGAEIFGAANDKEQAAIIFNMAKKMIIKDRFLSSKFKVYRNSIEHIKSSSIYKAISAISGTKHGPNLHSVLFDEIHAAKNDKLWHTLYKGTSSRSQPITWVLTNSGYIDTFAHQMHIRALAIKRGEIDEPAWHVVMYGLDGEDQTVDIFDRRLWKIVNPNWNEELKQSMEDQSREVRQMPTSEPVFRRLRLGMWVGKVDAWIANAQVKKCRGTKIKLPKYNEVGGWSAWSDLDKLRGRVAYGGLDFAYSVDINSYSLLLPPEGDRPTVKDPFLWLVFSWLPEAALFKREQNDYTNFRLWHKNGWINTVPGNAMEYDQMIEQVIRLHAILNIKGTAYDRYKAWGVVSQLQKEGLEMYDFPQGPATMGTTVDALTILWQKKYINYCGNPLMPWQMGNVMLYADRNGNKWIAKDKSKDKVDGPVSLCNAYALYAKMNSEQPEEELPEDYKVVSIRL